MMRFFTEVPLKPSENPLSYESKIVSLGSCFAENIGQKFQFYQFRNFTNPFGVIFNPVSIEMLIRRAIENNYFTAQDIFSHNEMWHCYEVHSRLSHPDKETFLQNLNKILATFQKEIKTASHFIFTLGTSWVYKTKSTERIVANCHKIPQKEFTKHLLSAAETLQSLNKIVKIITEINPNSHFIFTISPVRHLKDGFSENQISKSNLIVTVYHFLQDKNLQHNLHYFPSYEIMMDELRDYRFYSEDLLHPNTAAIDYIWEKFVESNIQKAITSTMNDVETIQKSLQHRPIHSDSISHQKFLADLQKKIDIFHSQYPFMQF